MKWFNPVAKLKKVLYSVLIIGSMIMMVVGIVLGIMIFKESQKKAGTLLIATEALLLHSKAVFLQLGLVVCRVVLVLELHEAGFAI